MFKHIKKVIVAAALFLPTAHAAATDYTLHRYTATPDKWNTNSYWLEADDGIVLIDAQLLIEDAKLLASMIKSTGKEVKGAIITHAHPDHIGGLNTLKKELGNFPVVTSKGTADTFEAMREQASSYIGSIYGNRFDQSPFSADQIISGKESVTLAGITFEVEDIGPGESMNATLIYEPVKNILFSGDATMHHGHVYTGEGRSDDFLRQLNHIKTNYSEVSFIHAGHGDPARIAHVDWQIDYIKNIQSVVTRILDEDNYLTEDGNRLNSAIITKYIEEVLHSYPSVSDYGYPASQIVGSNIAGVIKEKRQNN